LRRERRLAPTKTRPKKTKKPPLTGSGPALPPGTTVESSAFHGFSHTGFATTKLNARTPEGEPVRYFVKYIAGAAAEPLLLGEFEGMRAIAAITPHLVPHALGTGLTATMHTLLFPEGDVPIAWYLVEYLNLTPVMDIPPAKLVAEGMRSLHVASMAHPTNPGTFGFHMDTYNGRRLQPISPPHATWDSLWSVYLQNVYDQSCEANPESCWPEFGALMARVRSRLIPRMLGPDTLREPASRGGGPLRPALLHGDLWDGNVAVSLDHGGLIMFDCSVLWGHNEADLMFLSCPTRLYSHTTAYRDYFDLVEPSEPREEHEDRRRMYLLREFFGRSIRSPGHVSRQL
jgi:protein-ribulosamine 3-kinase